MKASHRNVWELLHGDSYPAYVPLPALQLTGSFFGDENASASVLADTMLSGAACSLKYIVSVLVGKLWMIGC